MNDTELQPEPVLDEPQTYPPLHQHINNTCIPLALFQCSPTTSCILKCDPSSLLETNESSTQSCVIEGDLEVNGTVPTVSGSIVETTTISIVGVMNVTGNVVVAGEVTLKLSLGSILNVGKCLVLEDETKLVVVIESEGGTTNDYNDSDESVLLATYDGSCSSSLVERVRIEAPSSFDECRDGRPTIKQVEEVENGKSHLELFFLPVDESECNDSSSEVNVLAIAVAVPVVVLVIVVIVVVMTVPKVREKVFPFARRTGN